MSGDDGLYVFSLAANCAQYEADQGPAQVNVGSVAEPRMVARSEALRHLYARSLLEHLDADTERLAATDRYCQAELEAMQHQQYWIQTRNRRAAAGDPNADNALGQDERRAWSSIWRCALDLCHRAGDLVHEADIVDGQTRQRFLAGIRHQNTVDIMGAIPEVE